MKLTKTGHRRKGKCNITHTRLYLRDHLWASARFRLRVFLKARSGEQSRMARVLGISDSQIHRYSCPRCEHDQEPSFSIGVAILLYIATHERDIIL